MIVLFVMPKTQLESDQSINISPTPFDTYSISWHEFNEKFSEDHPNWKKYSKTNLTTTIQQVSDQITEHTLEFIGEMLNQLNITHTLFLTTDRVLVDFDDIQIPTPYSKEFRFNLGTILKNTLVKEIKKLGHEVIFTPMNEDEYLEKNDTTDEFEEYK